MLKPILLLLALTLLLAQLGCGDDTPSEPSDTDPCDQGSAPSVGQYTGTGAFGGMNASGFCDSIGTRSIVVDGPVAFDILSEPTGFLDVDAPGDTVTVVSLSTRALDVLPEDPQSLTRSLFVDVTLRVPGDTTGVFVWVDDGPTDVSLRISIDSASVTYDKVIEASVTVTKNERKPNGSRSTSGEFFAIIESPDGKRIAVRGKFGE